MNWHKLASADPMIVQELSGELNVPKRIAELLVQRGVTNFSEAKYFFRPQWEDLHNPFLMKDMDRAVQRITQAMKVDEPVMVFGDYDVDGTTAVALVSTYLKTKLKRVLPYIPNRYTEGYGISKAGIDRANEEGIRLIVALDCGIKAHVLVDYAKELGIDFIICDHHLPETLMPNAIAVLDPKRSDCKYPYKELCGCGIGFKLIQALQQHEGSAETDLYPYLDLVATAIAADIVPMTGENRILSYLGLKQIQEAPRFGFQFFFSTLKKPARISDLVFVIAPRINAAGRMDQGINAVELLMATSLEEALPIARSIEFFNTERRTADERITKEALQQIELNEAQDKSTTVVYHPSWHKGVIGIVASRLIEQYYRPTVVLSKSGDVLVGSVRSVRGFDVYEALEACQKYMIQFGGHKYAAGLTMNEAQLEDFKAAFEAAVDHKIDPSQRQPSLVYDLEIGLEEITHKFYRILTQMAPFGPKNMRPTFVTHQCRDQGGSRLVGNDKDHLKLEIMDSSGTILQAIGFGLGIHHAKVKQKIPFSILYAIDENEFNGTTSLQLAVKDLRFEV